MAMAMSLAARAAPDATPQPEPVLPSSKDKGLIGLTLAVPGRLAAQVDASPVVQQMRETASDLVLSAMNFLGVRYRRGGNDVEQGFDCSGFTRYIFENSLGLVLPRRADQQAREAGLRDIRADELRPGDLVFFNTMKRAFSHVGIYVGEGKFIHAPRVGAEVRVEDMRASYWMTRFNGARRAEPLPAAALQSLQALPGLQGRGGLAPVSAAAP